LALCVAYSDILPWWPIEAGNFSAEIVSSLNDSGLGFSIFRSCVFGGTPNPISPSSIPVEFDALAARLLFPMIPELVELAADAVSDQFVSNCSILRIRKPVVWQSMTA
jgi:hypothetical protein